MKKALFLSYKLICEPHHEKTGFFAYAKTKALISFAVTAKLISAFVFAIRIVRSLNYLNPKFQASIHPLWLNSPFCVGPGRKPRRPVFSQRGSYKGINVRKCHIVGFYSLRSFNKRNTFNADFLSFTSCYILDKEIHVKSF